MRDYLHEIPKETLTVERIRQDIKDRYKGDKSGYVLFLSGAGIFAFLALIFEQIRDMMVVFLGMAISFALLALLLLIITFIGIRKTKQKITVDTDWLVDIKSAVEYVPGRHFRKTRPYYVFYFAKSGKYRLYVDIYGDNNYKWSKMYNMSNQGIYNYSHIGDEFYLVFSNNKKTNILLIYNKKLFELKEN